MIYFGVAGARMPLLNNLFHFVRVGVLRAYQTAVRGFEDLF